MNDAEQHLRSELGQGQFTAEYQPMVELATGRTTRFEALARWRRSDSVLLPPSRFIQLLEDTRTVQTLTTHILVSTFAVDAN